MASLLEAAAAVSIGGAVVALMSGSIAGAARVHASCTALGDELFQSRQLEHLIDRAVLVAGAGPGHPPAVSSLSGDAVVFAADHDGDGAVDTSSSETTALEIRQDGAEARVRLRLGRQTMTVLAADDSDASLVALDRRGLAADAATTSLVDLEIAARDGPATRVRRWRVAIPSWPAP